MTGSLQLKKAVDMKNKRKAERIEFNPQKDLLGYMIKRNKK